MAVHTVDRVEDVPDPVPDARFVVVDVIIATTSIVGLLDAGARYVRPFADPDAARAFGHQTDDAVLVGEHHGAPLDGFDHVPLPGSFAAADLADRPVGIYTTNGTRAVERLGRPDGLLVGSTINAAAVADRVRGNSEADPARDTWFVGAGYRGAAAPEDRAGVELIEHHYRGGVDGDAGENRDDLRAAIRDSPPARSFREMGLDAELETVLSFDSTATVPRLHDGVFVDEGAT